MESPILSQYLRLFHADWLSPIQFSRLLQKYHNLQGVITADESELLLAGLTEPQIERLRASPAADNQAEVERSLGWASMAGQAILYFEHPDYPALLQQIDVAPPLLFIRGKTQALNNPQFAIVGSRRATNYGLRNAYWMAYELSQSGLTISSGLARGIDTRASEGGLASEGNTLAIIGTGVDKVYPARNLKLADAISETGAIVSEFPLGTPPLPINFPRRNRIMSGLSLGTLVVEATVKSGSLITARLALEQNRVVFAIPGLISNPYAAGCHKLIADGARLVEKPDDILQELGLESPRETLVHIETRSSAGDAPATGYRAGEKLIRLIDYQGCELQNLLQASGLDYQVLIEQLLELEIAGKIHITGGRYYRS